jgi:methionyl-tRNA formyltransferase
MRIVFMGTPEFAVPILKRIAPRHNVHAVLTQPDRARGRGRQLTPTPVKAAAAELGIDVYQPTTLRDPEVLAMLERATPDAVVVAAYGLILPPEVLDIPRFGCINVHASLLPRHRGAAPVHRAILSGDTVTGVSIMLMEEGLDTGPVALTKETPVAEKTAEELTETLSFVGAEALSEVLGQLETGSVRWAAQDDSRATYAHKITPADVALAPDLTVDQALRRVRASTRSARSKVCVAGETLDVLDATDCECGIEPGCVLVQKNRLVLGLVDGDLELTSVRPAGRAAMDGACFARGKRIGDSATWECPS